MGIIRSKFQIMYFDESCTSDKCKTACDLEGYSGYHICTNLVVCNCGAYVDDGPTPANADDTTQEESGEEP